MSKANLIDSEEFATAVSGLAKNKISFSSYAIGPNMDVALLAAIANQTGGNIIVDSDEAGITDRAAKFLVATARGPVYWPENVKLPKEIVETYPATIPPLRGGSRHSSWWASYPSLANSLCPAKPAFMGKRSR